MKKLKTIQILGTTALTIGALFIPLSAQAVENNFSVYEGCNGKIRYNVIVGSNCNLADIFPDCNLPQLPDLNLPEIEIPDVDVPETEIPDADVPETESPDVDSSTISYMEQVVSLVNAERAKEGLSPLTLETDMTNAAMVRAKEIQTSFSHTRPDGTSFATALKEAGVSYQRSGENIAWGQKTPEIVVNAWMNSSGHRANIMNANFTRIGVGYLTNASGTPYWVQLFAN